MIDEERIEVYEGDDPYIFVSYCHKDKKFVYPLIYLMEKIGYKIWLDKGIKPGSDWPDVIAEHLENSSAVLAIVSNDSLESHNCRREFNFAIMENKSMIALVLGNVTFTPGMRMQMSTVQAINYSEIGKIELLEEKLSCIPFIVECKKRNSAKSIMRKEYYLRRKLTDELIEITHDGFGIGRKRDLCDYVINDNMTISKVHARFYFDESVCMVADCNSTNGTYINDCRIVDGKKEKLNMGDLIEMGSEKFYFIEVKEEL